MSSANLNIKITATIDNRGGAVSSTRRYSSTNVSISISSPCSRWTRTGRSVATVVSQREEATGKPNLRRGALGGQRWHRGRLWRMNVARSATADRTGCDHSTSEALSRPGRVQGVVATRPRWCESSSSLKASDGVFQPSVFRGRRLSVAATAATSLALCRLRSVPLGKYWRSRPLVFSFVPRCHGLRGSQKKTCSPVSIRS